MTRSEWKCFIDAIEFGFGQLEITGAGVFDGVLRVRGFRDSEHGASTHEKSERDLPASAS